LSRMFHACSRPGVVIVVWCLCFMLACAYYRLWSAMVYSSCVMLQIRNAAECSSRAVRCRDDLDMLRNTREFLQAYYERYSNSVVRTGMKNFIQDDYRQVCEALDNAIRENEDAQRTTSRLDKRQMN
jgi:hypothetical protein